MHSVNDKRLKHIIKNIEKKNYKIITISKIY